MPHMDISLLGSSAWLLTKAVSLMGVPEEHPELLMVRLE